MPIKKKPRTDEPKKTYEKPVSLYPLDFEEAMKRLLGTNAEKIKNLKRNYQG